MLISSRVVVPGGPAGAVYALITFAVSSEQLLEAVREKSSVVCCMLIHLTSERVKGKQKREKFRWVNMITKLFLWILCKLFYISNDFIFDSFFVSSTYGAIESNILFSLSGLFLSAGYISLTTYSIWIWIMFRNKQKILRKNIERTNGWNARKYETFFFSFRLPISRYRYFRVKATAGRPENASIFIAWCASRRSSISE